jgi:hypothetical protein
VGLLLFGVGCQTKETFRLESEENDSVEPTVPLTDAFLTRAITALESRLKPDSEVLEIRATGRIFSVQLRAKKAHPASDKTKAIKPGTLVQIDYVERAMEAGQPPIGRIFGPQPLSTMGKGDPKENIFPLSDIDLEAMARAFNIAKLAIDPEDGKVVRLVVRRYLPFSLRVRGRIFVESPRMSGSIDVNERGVALRR